MVNIDEEKEQVVENSVKKLAEERGGRGESSFPNNKNNSSGSKEEGELSASDNDDRNICSTNQLMNSDAAPLEQQVHIHTVNENSQNAQAEKLTSSSKMGCSVDMPSRTPQESAHLKSSKKNREHFVPFLISFSDDSGSDCENSGQKKISASKNRTLAADKFVKPPAPAPQKPQKLQKVTRNEAKLIPNRGAVSHRASSLLTKPDGGISGNAGHLHSLRKTNNSNKVATLHHGKRSNVHLNSSKLHDLRQLITMRENQLNLDRLQNTKKLSSASCRDVNLVNKRNLVERTSRETSYDNLQELQESDKKRQKIVSTNTSRGFSNSQEIMSTVIGSEKCAVKDSDQLKPANHSSGGGKYPSSVTAGQLKQKEYQGSSSTNPSLTLKDGIDATRNRNQSSSNSSKEVASKAASKLVYS